LTAYFPGEAKHVEQALDRRFQFVYNYVWELPFFRGAKGLKGG